MSPNLESRLVDEIIVLRQKNRQLSDELVEYKQKYGSNQEYIKQVRLGRERDTLREDNKAMKAVLASLRLKLNEQAIQMNVRFHESMAQKDLDHQQEIQQLKDTAQQSHRELDKCMQTMNLALTQNWEILNWAQALLNEREGRNTGRANQYLHAQLPPPQSIQALTPSLVGQPRSVSLPLAMEVIPS